MGPIMPLQIFVPKTYICKILKQGDLQYSLKLLGSDTFMQISNKLSKTLNGFKHLSLK
jgi:hypothetical protein